MTWIELTSNDRDVRCSGVHCSLLTGITMRLGFNVLHERLAACARVSECKALMAKRVIA